MKKYQVIYADPPWSYDNKKTGGTHMISGVEDHYASTMSVEQICDMNIPSDKNAVLFLWATVPLMPEAFQVMTAWGFKYKTMLTWRKTTRIGLGYWFRGECEHLLFGVKGKVKAFRTQFPNFHESGIGKHSEKPPHFRELINQSVVNSFENPNKLELFARQRDGLIHQWEYAGWDLYGNELENSISL